MIFLRYEKEILSKVNVVDELKFFKNLLGDSDIPLAYCHNDLLVKNIIYNKEEGTVNVNANTCTTIKVFSMYCKFIKLI